MCWYTCIYLNRVEINCKHIVMADLVGWLVGWLVGNRGKTVVQCIKIKNNCRPRHGEGTVGNKSHKCCPFIFVSFSEISIYIMLISSYLCLRVVQRLRGPMHVYSFEKKSQSNLR